MMCIQGPQKVGALRNIQRNNGKEGKTYHHLLTPMLPRVQRGGRTSFQVRRALTPLPTFLVSYAAYLVYVRRLQYIAKRRPISTLLANLARGREVEPSSQTSLFLFLAAWRHPLANRSVSGFDQKTLLLSSVASMRTDRNRMLKPQLTIYSSRKPLICWGIA